MTYSLLPDPYESHPFWILITSGPIRTGKYYWCFVVLKNDTANIDTPKTYAINFLILKESVENSVHVGLHGPELGDCENITETYVPKKYHHRGT